MKGVKKIFNKIKDEYDSQKRILNCFICKKYKQNVGF